MSLRDEQDKEGNTVRKHTLTYQSGKYAGSEITVVKELGKRRGGCKKIHAGKSAIEYT